MKQRLAVDTNEFKRLQLEYKILQQLQNSHNICTVHDAFNHQDGVVTYWCVIFTLYKEDLSERIRKARETTKNLSKNGDIDLQITKWMHQLANGICEIHEKHITHRDLNPKNLFLDESDRLVIGDFGCSKEQTKGHSTLIGTAGYFAPEILKGNYDKSTDMWSIGCILMDLLTFTTPAETKHRKINPTNVWNDVVQRLMNEDPTKRMTAVALRIAVRKIQNAQRKEGKQYEEEELQWGQQDEEDKKELVEINQASNLEDKTQQQNEGEDKTEGGPSLLVRIKTLVVVIGLFWHLGSSCLCYHSSSVKKI